MVIKTSDCQIVALIAYIRHMLFFYIIVFSSLMVRPEGGLGLLWQNAYKIFSIVSSQSLSLLNALLTAAPEAESNER